MRKKEQKNSSKSYIHIQSNKTGRKNDLIKYVDWKKSV